MALDATVGGTSADSYDTLANFKSYADDIGYDYSSFTDDTIEENMRKAAQYLDRAYRGKWKGFRSDRDQTLAWPRSASQDLPVNFLTPSFTTGVIDEDGYEVASNIVPQQVKDAQFEATIISLDGTTLLPEYSRGNAIRRTKNKAGPVETETEYASSAPTRDRFLTIEGLLEGLVNGHPGATAGSGSLVRS